MRWSRLTSATSKTSPDDTGGHTMRVGDASALQDTLSCLRQRYALYLYLPQGVKSAGYVRVDLAQQALIMYATADIRYRHAPISGNGQPLSAGPTRVTRAPAPITDSSDVSEPSVYNTAPPGRRKMVNEDSTQPVNMDIDSDDTSQPQSGATPATPPTQQPSSKPAPSQQQGWPKADPPSAPPQ